MTGKDTGVNLKEPSKVTGKDKGVNLKEPSVR